MPCLSSIRRRAWGAVLLATALASAGCKSCDRTAPPVPQKRNVVIVLSDALRAASLPLYGYRRDTAPHLTELARESIVFDTHLAHYPGTPESISQLLTGRLKGPLLLDYKYLAVPVRGIPDDLFILPQALRAAGYRTGVVTGHTWFTEHTRLLQYADSTTLVPKPAGHDKVAFEDLMPAIAGFVDQAARDRQPFFLYVHDIDTHGPHAVHPGFEQFRDASDYPDAYNLYDSEILYTDHWVHQLVEHLRTAGVWDNTIFAFTADHGEELGELGPERWNRNHGYTVRRVLMHVPLLVHLPGDPRPGRRYVGLTRHIDVAPTLMRLAVPGASLAPYRVDGDDLSGELLAGGDGGDTHRRSYAWSLRYWGLYEPGLEVHYDQWENTFSPVYRPAPDAHNYPRLEAVDDAEQRATLVQALAEEVDRRTREYLELPPAGDLPDAVEIGVPTTVLPSSASRPTFESVPNDDRWTHDGALLECGPAEQPGAIALATPWVPGRYQVFVGLHRASIKNGYRDECTLAFAGAGNVPRQIRASDADAQGWVDTGEQTLGSQLEVTISAPEGGVAIYGFRLRRAAATGTPGEDDAARKERLRALGYGEPSS